MEPELEEARKLYYRGADLLGRGQYADAIEHFSDCLELYPNFFCARLAWALCHAKMGDYAAAIRFLDLSLDRFLNDNPLRAMLLSTLASIHLTMNSYEDAKVLLLELIRKHTQDEVVHNNLATLYCRTGRFDKAFHYFLRAARLAQNHSVEDRVRSDEV